MIATVMLVFCYNEFNCASPSIHYCLQMKAMNRYLKL